MEGERGGRERKRNSTVIYNLKTITDLLLLLPPLPLAAPPQRQLFCGRRERGKGRKGKGGRETQRHNHLVPSLFVLPPFKHLPFMKV